MLRSLADMSRYKLVGKDGDLGGIKDFLYDSTNWDLRFIVVDTGSWLSGRKVLVSPAAVLRADGSERVLEVDLTKEQVENGPPLEAAKPVSKQMEDLVSRHYGWPAALGTPLGTARPYAGTLRPESVRGESSAGAAVAEADELRSVNEVVGYHIQASDGEIGHVEEFVVDDATWTIRYTVVDTKNWLPGRKVLVPPSWVTRTQWIKRRVHVDVTRDEIEACPEYDPSEPVNRRYEEQLYDYYGRPAYWND